MMIDQLSDVLGREATADDMEPATWALARRGQQASAVEHARALSALSRFRRRARAAGRGAARCGSGGPTGTTCW
jgi:hypothetical protein